MAKNFTLLCSLRFKKLLGMNYFFRKSNDENISRKLLGVEINTNKKSKLQQCMEYAS